MDQIHHLHAFVIVQFTVEDIAPGRSDIIQRRLIVKVVVAGLQFALTQVGKQLFHAPFGLTQKDGIGVRLGLLGMQHGGDTTENDLDAFGAIKVGDLPTAFGLNRKHHGNAYGVHRIVKIDGLQIFIDKIHLDIRRQCGGKNHRTVGRQMKFGLAGQFGPFRVDQFDFMVFPFVLGLRNPMVGRPLESVPIHIRAGRRPFSSITNGMGALPEKSEWPVPAHTLLTRSWSASYRRISQSAADLNTLS